MFSEALRILDRNTAELMVDRIFNIRCYRTNKQYITVDNTRITVIYCLL